MGSSTAIFDGGIEQTLKGFASFSALCTVLAELTAQVKALRAEIAEMRESEIVPKSKPARWLKLREAAEILNMSPKTVRRYIERGLIGRNAATRHILIPAEDVEGLREKITI